MKKRLPARGKAVAGKRPTKAPTKAPTRTKSPAETILMVDDDEGTRVHMAKALARRGYAFLEAGDGEEALTLSMARKGPIHLLITDVMMPVMNGKELAERLCVMRPEIRILYVSGYTREEVLSDSRDCAAKEWWLAKPFTGAQLLTKVRQILAGPIPL